LARGSSGGSSSPAAALRRPQEVVLRRAGSSVRPTSRHASSMGVRRSAKRAQVAMVTHGAMCSTAAAMAGTAEARGAAAAHAPTREKRRRP
jgi:hypothetical protein